jgi:hypothetical protein
VATRTTKAEYKCTNDAYEECGKHAYTKPIYKPGCGWPTCSQDGDNHQAHPQVPEPGTKRLPNSHGLGPARRDSRRGILQRYVLVL